MAENKKTSGNREKPENNTGKPSASDHHHGSMQTEEELEKHRGYLEILVEERTVELRKLNEQLQEEIVERKWVLYELEESERRYRELFNYMSSGVAVYEATSDGKDFVLRDFNKAGEKIDSIKKEKIIGEKVTEVFPAVREFGLLDVFRRVWKTGKPEHLPATLYKDNRISGWRENYVYKLPSGEIVAVYDDITGLMQTEETLRIFSTAVENAPDGVQIVGLDGHIIYSNKAVANIYGFSVEEFRGKHVNELNVDPDIAGKEIMPKVMETGRWTGELMVRHKKGRIFPVWLTTSVVNNTKGEPVARIGIIRDITERKKIEEEILRTRQFYADILNSIVNGVWVTDKDDIINYINKGMEKIAGIPFTQILGTHVLTRLEEKSMRSFGPYYLEAKDLLKPVHYDAVPLMTHAGRQSFQSGWLIPITREGSFDGMICTVEDITESKLAREEAQRAGHLAALGELAAGVAHEINNPLNGIINYAQILANMYEQNEKERDITGRIINEGNRIANIVKNLLSFARDSKEAKHPVLVNEIFSTVLSLVETQLKRDRITLKKHIPPDLPKILAQPQQIEQVLLNIISNSRHALNQKYEGAHKDKIIELLGEKVIIEKKPFLRIAVLDHGSGIPTDMLDKVLNPFFSSKPADQGTGLGLSISHGIITDHNGKMSIESMEGKFTRVVIDLPADEKGNEE